jgi:hypothetical protein
MSSTAGRPPRSTITIADAAPRQPALLVHQLLDAAREYLSLHRRQIIAALQFDLNRVERGLGV